MELFRQLLQKEYRYSLIQQIYSKLPSCVREYHQIKIISDYIFDRRFVTDDMFRAELYIYLGLVVNLFYAALQLMIALFCHSLWSSALAVYYALLAEMRFQILKPNANSENEELFLSELKKYRICGLILLFMTPLFACFLILVVHKDGGAKYPGIMVCVMAVYAFYTMISSIVNLVRYKKQKHPAMLAAKVVNLTAAMMSILSLVTAILSRITDPVYYTIKQGVIGTTGGAVCIFVLGMSIHMVVNATKQLKSYKLKTENKNYKIKT